jgi:hypothetical protein
MCVLYVRNSRFSPLLSLLLELLQTPNLADSVLGVARVTRLLPSGRETVLRGLLVYQRYMAGEEGLLRA